jgi:hypothetical protein
MTVEELDLSDPGYLRHCLRPDCKASFNIGAVYSGLADARGWRLVKPVNGYLCPSHAGPCISGEHMPDWLVPDMPDGSATGILCSCLWQWKPQPGERATAGRHFGEWAAHLVAATEGLPRRLAIGRDEKGFAMLADDCPGCGAAALIINEWDAIECLSCSWREFEPPDAAKAPAELGAEVPGG